MSVMRSERGDKAGTGNALCASGTDIIRVARKARDGTEEREVRVRRVLLFFGTAHESHSSSDIISVRTTATISAAPSEAVTRSILTRSASAVSEEPRPTYSPNSFQVLETSPRSAPVVASRMRMYPVVLWWTGCQDERKGYGAGIRGIQYYGCSRGKGTCGLYGRGDELQLQGA
jgi:hypothetical protein